MAAIKLNATGSCAVGGGQIIGSWTTTNPQTVTVTITGSNTPFTQSENFTNVTGGVFDFNGLADDVYIVEATGGGISDPKFINISCGNPPPPGCDTVISSIDVTPPATGGNNNAVATIYASGSGALDYSIDGTTFQPGNIFTALSPGNYTAYVRNGAIVGCVVQAGFIVPEVLELTATATPLRDWLPVGLPVSYTFQSPDAIPEALTVVIEVSTNGFTFDNVLVAGILHLPPDESGAYTVNVAPYLQAMFDIAPPALGNVDFNIFKYYRLLAGKLSAFDGTNKPELTTEPQHVINATVLTPYGNNGFINLSYQPYDALRSENQDSINTFINLSEGGTGTLRNQVLRWDEENPTPQVCAKYPMQLYWLNRSGGWQTWVFDGKHENFFEVEDPQEWQDADFNTHRASYPAVQERVQVYSGFIPAAAYQVVAGITHSIRVYHYDNGQWREVNIEPGSYLKDKRGLNRKELNLEFTYANPLQIQRA